MSLSLNRFVFLLSLMPLVGWSQAGGGRARAVGEPDRMVAGALSAGGVRIQVWEDGQWRNQADIISPAPTPFARFGAACVLLGDTLLVGEDAMGFPPRAGMVWTFTRVGGFWRPGMQFQAPKPETGDRFGSTLTIRGNTVEVGAKGTIFTYRRTLGLWALAGSRPDSILAIGAPSQDPQRLRRTNPLPNNAPTSHYGEVLTPRTVLNTSPPSLSSSQWTPIGPAPLQAADNGGKVSGRITGIAVDTTDATNSTIYVTAAGGGVWKTTDGGSTWTPLTDTQATLSMGAIAIAPSNHKVIYAGTGEANNSASDSNYGLGILVSTDGGASWTLSTGPNGIFTTNRLTFAQISVHPTNSNIAYAAASNAGINAADNGGTGIYKTTDGGVTWTDTTSSIESDFNWSAVVIDPNTPTIVYAAHGEPSNAVDSGTNKRKNFDNGVYASNNSGATWELLAGPVDGETDSDVGRIALAVAPSASTAGSHRLYVVSGKISTNGLGYFGRYDNADAASPTFTTPTAPTPDFLGGKNSKAGDDGTIKPGGQSDYDIAIGVNPTNADIVYGAGMQNYDVQNSLAQMVYVSQNAGSTWTDISTLGGIAPHTDCHAVAFDLSGRMLLATDGGIWRYDPSAGSWTNLNGNLNTIQFEGLGLHPTDTGIVLAGSQDNGIDLYKGSYLWNEVVGGDGGNALISQQNPSIMYGLNPASINPTNFLRVSTDGGQTFVSTRTPSVTNEGILQFAPAIALDPSNGSSVFLPADLLYTTTDAGLNWEEGTNPASPALNMISVAVLSGGKIIYASVGDDYQDTTVYFSTDEGVTWTKRNLPVAASVHELDIDPNDTSGATAYAVINTFNANGQVYKTTNSGTTWTNISGNLPKVPVWSLKVDTDSNHTVYVGNEQGVYSSTSPYSTWNRFGSGLPNVQVRQVQLNSALHLLGAATHGRGVWQILTATTVTDVTSSHANGTFGAGEVIPIQVAFGGTVSVAGGTPKLALNSGGTATYTSGSGTNTLTFTYTVATGDSTNGADLDEKSTTALTLNGATITDASGRPAILALPAPGADGSLSANEAIVIAIADMTIQKAHSGTFLQGGTGSYTIRARNSGGVATSGQVTVTDSLPIGLTATGISGTAWSCVLSTLTCTRSDSLNPSTNYPDITLNVNIAANAPASVTNTATVSGGGETNTSNDTATDVATIGGTPDLKILKSHSGNFAQGQVGAQYTISVSNVGGAATSGTVQVVDTLPSQMTATAISGSGWNCTLNNLTCTQSNALAPNSSYSTITLTVNVASNALSSLTNSATVSGGGDLNSSNNTATDPTNITGLPDMIIQKSHTGNFALGQTGVYTIKVGNFGVAFTTAPVTVSDTLPAGLTAVAASGVAWSCTTGTTVTCTRSDPLPPLSYYPSISLTVNVASNAGASVTNTATVSGGGEINTSNNSSSDTTNLVTPAPDLTIAKHHSGSFQQGQTGASYTITVTNSGTAATSGQVTVTDTLPSGLTATAISGTNWSCTLGTLSCTRSDALSATASYPVITVQVNVAANASTSLTNTATVTGGGDSNAANNTATDPTTIAAVVPVLSQIFPDTATAGGSAFTLSVLGANFQQGDVIYWNNTALTTTYQTTGLLTAAVGSSFIATAGTADVTVLSPGGASSGYAPFTVSATAVRPLPSVLAGYGWSPATGVFTGGFVQFTSFSSGLESGTTASWNGTNLGTLGIVSGQVGVNVPASLIQVPGSAFVTISNPGAPSYSVQLVVPATRTLTSTLPAAVSAGASATSLTVNGSGFVNGDQIYVVPGPGALTTSFVSSTQLQAIVPASALTSNSTLQVWVNTSSTSGSFSSTNQIPLTVGTGAPALSIKKTHSGNFQQGQQNATYTVTVSNPTGTATTQGATVTVTDTIPSGLTVVSMAGTGWTCSNGTSSCTRSDSLAGGTSYPSITVTVNVSNSAPSLMTNQVSVSGGGAAGSATAFDLTSVLAGLGDLTITKSHTGNFYQGQSAATYTILVSNVGGNPTSGTVTVTDNIPGGMLASAATGTSWSCTVAPSTVTCTRSDALAGGASYPAITLTVSVRPNAAASITNTATVSGGGESNLANDTANDPTIITTAPDLTIAKSHTGSFFQQQNGAPYTITVSNAGQGTTTGTVTVVDSLPAGLTAATISGTNWNCTLSSVTCTRTDGLTSGSSYPPINLTVNVAANASSSLTNTATVSGGGENNTANDTATDLTTIIQAASDLTVAVTHTGNFYISEIGAAYTITVSNIGSVSTVGTVTVTNGLLTNGLAATAMSGTGWTCDVNSLTCTRGDGLPAGSSYPPITLTLNIARITPTSVTDTVTVSGGGESITTNDQAQDVTTIIQAPILNYFFPNAAVAGDPAFTCTLNGTGIAPGAVVSWNGVSLPTTFVSATQATATVSASLISVAGTASIKILNSGTAASAAQTFTILASPTAPQLSFPTTGYGWDNTTGIFTGAFLQLQGANFVAGMTAAWNGTSLGAVSMPASGPPTVPVPANLIQVAGTAAITATDPGTAASTARTITIVPTRTLTSLSPQTVTPGSGGFTLTVNGTGFQSVVDTVYLWPGGPALTTTFISANQLQATVPASALVSPGILQVWVDTSGQFASTNQLPFSVQSTVDLTIAKSHSGNFTQGQAGATYSLTVSNVGTTASAGAVTVTDTLPAGLVPTAIAGTGWTCGLVPLSCTRNDSLAAGASYPAITVTVTVAANAPSSVTNTATVSGGGETYTANDTANDLTTILSPPADMTVIVSHVGSFAQGQTGALYTITVSNSGAGSSSGTVAVTDTLPTGMTATNLAGTGWNCTLATLTCSRSDVLTPGSSYPAISLAVTVAGNAASSLTNTVTVAGGGETNTANDSATDPTTVTPPPPDLTISQINSGNFTQGQNGASYTITVSNIGTGPTTALVTVVDTLPTGLTATAMTGSGWICTLATLTCTRSDALAASSAYPGITLTVNVAANAAASFANIATVSGGGEPAYSTSNDVAVDSTAIVPPPPDLTITSSHTGSFPQGQLAAYTITISNSGSGASSGVVTMVDNLPAGLTASTLSGTGWNCVLATLTCTRSDVLAAGSSYSTINLTVAVAVNAASSLTNIVTVAGGGEINTANDQAQDVTSIVGATLIPQTITFGALSSVPYPAPPFLASATASSGLPVTFTSMTTSVCTVAGSIVNVVAAGSCTVQANQAGNISYLPASASRSFFAGNPSGTLTAAAAGPFTAGTNPFAVAIADFNGDGKPDLAVANNGGGNASVLLGDGNGGFTAGGTLPAGTNPAAIVAGDFNGDGKADLAILNSGSNNLTVLLGNGAGSFNSSTGSPFAAGSQPSALAVGDFNGDGRADLAIADFGGNNVTVLLGDGTGAFHSASGSPFAAGTSPTSVVAADFNGDGRLDIAIANGASNNVTVLLGDGAGGFAAAAGSPFAAGGSPRSVAAGDFNRDGKFDLAIADSATGNVTVLLGDGSGGFTPATGSPFGAGTNPISVAMGDLDGDGIADLAVANYGSNGLTVLLGDGAGGFTTATGSPFGTGSHPYFVALGDLNSDGKADAAIPNSGANNVTVLLGASAATSPALNTTAGSTVPSGASVPLTLTIGQTGFRTPTGAAMFYDGATVLGTASQTSSPYTFSTSGLALGSHSFTAVYSGDPRTAGGISGSILIQAGQTGQTITFGPLSNVVYGSAPITVSATATSGLQVSFSAGPPAVCTNVGATVTITGGGTCTVQATQPGDGTWAAATPVSQSFTVTPQSQTISFSALQSVPLGAAPFAVSASASSQLPVSFTSLTGSVCVVTNGIVSLSTTGTCTIQASQSGNANFSAASSVTQSFLVTTGTGTGNCDANQDGITSPTDIQTLIGEALGTLPPSNYYSGGTAIRVVDVQIVVKAVLGGTCMGLSAN